MLMKLTRYVDDLYKQKSLTKSSSKNRKFTVNAAAKLRESFVQMEFRSFQVAKLQSKLFSVNSSGDGMSNVKQDIDHLYMSTNIRLVLLSNI